MLDKRMRRKVFNEIDLANFRTSFMFCNPEFNEMWFCYPSQGSLQPDTAVVWNYSEKEIGVPTRVEGITFRSVELGEVEESDPETWASAVGVWDDDFVPWNLVSRHKLVAASPDNNKLYMLDQGTTRDGVAFLGTLAREGLALLGRDRTGSPIVDFEAMKMVRALWPKIRGGPVEVRVGSQMLVDGPITWNPVTVFDPTQSGPQGVRTGFVPLSGRALAVQFEGANAWRIDGYKYDVVKLGTF
jgi:hypothetical protein